MNERDESISETDNKPSNLGTRVFVSAPYSNPRILSPTKFLVALSAIFIWHAITHPGDAETLEDALSSAYMTNPQILAERANLRATDENVPQALSGYRPTIALTTQAGRQDITSGPATRLGGTPEHTLDDQESLDAKLVQPLYSGGGTVASTSAAEDAVIAERANNLATEETVLFAVITAYYDVLRDIAVIDYDRKYEAALQQLVTGTRGTAKIGALTQVDVAQTESRLQSAQAQRAIDEAALEADQGEYEHAVGHLPEALTTPKLSATLPATASEAINLATKNNPDVISKIYSERAASDEITVSEAQLLPSIGLVLERQVVNGVSIRGVTTNSSAALVQLTIPFYDAGLNWSKSRQQIENFGHAKGQTDDARRQASQNARAAWQLAIMGRTAVAAFGASVVSDQKAVVGARQQQLAGQLSILDLLIEQQQLYTDQISFERTSHDQHLAEFNVMMQIGTLTATDLRLNVHPYNPNTHYDSVRSKLIGLGSSN